ncbi:MAG: ROK family protein [Sphingomonas sp.]
MDPASSPDAPVFAGVELGGTKCVCTLATGPDGVLAQATVPTTDPEETLSAIAAVLRRWRAEREFAGLGIASFGPVDLNPDSPSFGYILTTTKPGWSMTDVGARLAEPFPVPLGFDTDVNGAALGEIAGGRVRASRTSLMSRSAPASASD